MTPQNEEQKSLIADLSTEDLDIQELMELINDDDSLKALVLENNRQILLRGHLRWYKVGHVFMLGLWGAWVFVLRPFSLSASYDVMKVLGVGPVTGEAFVGSMAMLISIVAHRMLSPSRARLVVVALVFSMVFGFICALFFLGQPRSTAVFMYGFIGLLHFFAFVDLFINLAPGRFNSITI